MKSEFSKLSSENAKNKKTIEIISAEVKKKDFILNEKEQEIKTLRIQLSLLKSEQKKLKYYLSDKEN